MACKDWSDYGDALVEGGTLDAIICPNAELLGMAVFALMFYAPIGLAIWRVSNSLIIPFVLAVLLAGVVAQVLPAIGISMLGLLVILALPAFLYRMIVSRTKQP